MINLKKSCLVVIFLLTTTSFLLYAQNNMADYNPLPKQVIPPSPEGASLGKYGTVPISLFEGKVSYNLPIFDLNLGNCKVPVSINYSSNGIKVNEIASNVGLGWTLFAGGAITVVTNDKPDLDNSYYKNLPIDPLTFNPNVESAYDPDYTFARGYTSDVSIYDTQPDEFYYNFCGYTGKFLMDNNRLNFYSQPLNNFKIVYDSNTGFIITDDKGTTYEFSIAEVTNIREDCVFGVTNPRDFKQSTKSTFYLTKVKDSNGNEISLSYDRYSYQYPTGYVESKYINNPSGSCGSLSNRDRKCLQYQGVYGARVKQIISRNAKIIFDYDITPREDLETNLGASESKRLASVKIFRFLENNQDELVKSFEFTHDYYRSNLFTSQLNGEERAVNSRLRLLSVKEQSAPPHIFQYDSKSLPSRLAFSVDWYGFYNGTNNTTGIPKIDGAYNSGADKAVKIQFLDAGILKKISFPTGGTTELEYEPNIFEGMLVRDSVRNMGLELHSDGTNLLVRDTLIVLSIPSSNVRLQYNIPPASTRSSATITRPDGTIVNLTGVGSVNNFLINQIGNYIVRITNRTTDDAYVNITWIEKTSIAYPGIEPKAGLRIKKSTNTDKNGIVLTSKSYVYLDPQGKSSLHMFKGVGSYQDEYTTRQTDQSQITYECDYTILSSNPNSIIGADSDNLYGYRYVSEFDDASGSQGKKQYVFSLGVLDYLNSYSQSNQYDDGTQGKTIKIENYKFDVLSSSYKIVERTVHSYRAYFNPDYFWSPSTQANPPKQNSVYGLKLRVLIPETPAPQGLSQPYAAKYLVETYLKLSFFQFLEKEEVYTFAADTTHFLTSATRYYYDNLDHLLCTRIEKVASDGRISVLKRTYPNDMINRGFQVPYSDMVAKNMLEIVEEEFSTDGVSQEIKRRNYTAGLSSIANLILPSSVESKFKQEETELRSRILSYNQFGAPLCVLMEGGLKTCYLYSYNSEYPIAEIKNADYLTVQEVLGGPTSVTDFASLYPTDAQINAFIGILRNSNLLKEAKITSFTFKPLIGMTSMTDAKGMTTTYEYDTFQRLMNVKDQNGNILKHTDYHYQN